MSFDISALKLQIDTSQLDEAIRKINDLKKGTENLGKPSSGRKPSIGPTEDDNKNLSKAEKLVEKLKQTYEDLSNEFTRGESAVLRYARSLGVSGQEMQVIIGYLQNIKNLSKDPFDDSIGSVRRIKREYEELTNRTDLLTKGISLTTKQAREYSRLAYEVAGKMQAQGLDPLLVNLDEYTKRVTKEREEYLKYVKQVSDLKQKESPVVQSKSSIAVSPANMDQHVLVYQSNLLKTEAAEKKSFDRRLENLRNFNSRREQSLNQMQGAGGVTTAEMANIAGQESALRRLGVGKISDLVGNREAMLEVQRAGDNAVKAWNAANRTIKSSREMAFAMRQVPMQITDIVVSLAGGQSPFQVLLQQGGQLKDLFGGVKEAAVALGKGLVDSLFSAFKLLLNPLGLAITALGIFSYAIYSVIDRTEQFNKQLILLGSTAKVSLLDTIENAKLLADSTSTSMTKAGTAFIEISKATGLMGQPLREAAQAAINLEKQGGQSIAETAKALSSLKENPLEAMIKLNEQVGFLTPNLVTQANAFILNGEKAKASALLIQEYSKAQEEIANKLKENKGNFATLFSYLKEGATEVMDKFGTMSMDIINRMSEPILELLGLMDKVNKKASSIKPKNPEWVTGGTLSLGNLAMSAGSAQAENLQSIINFATKNDDKLKTKLTRSQVDKWIESLSPEARLANASYIKAAKESPEYTGVKNPKTFGVDFGVRGEYDKYMNKQLEAEDKYLETQKKISKQGNDLLADYQLQTKEQLQQLEIKSRVLGMSAEEKFVEEAKLKSLEQYQKIRERILQQMPEGYQKDKALTEAETAYNAQVQIVESQAKLYYQNMESFSTGWDKTYEKYKQDTMTAAGFAEKAFTKMADGMTDAIMQFVTTGKVSFKDFTASILSDLLRIQIRKQAVGFLGDSSSSIAGIGSSIAGLLGLNSGADTANLVASGYNLIGGNGGSYTPALFANGGAFTNSVVNNPTLFKFANGAKFGVMGEAGPEAVMPLSRDSSGRLGVTMQGGSSGDVQVVINNTGTSSVVTNKTESVDSRGNRRIELTLADAVAGEAARPGSSMYNATRNSFGLRPALVSR